MEDLTGRVAIVTGGATGIGSAIVERFLACGAHVACCYNKSGAAAEALERKTGRDGKRLFTVQMDVSNGQQVQSALNSIVRHFGCPTSILVNNAGDIINTVGIT